MVAALNNPQKMNPPCHFQRDYQSDKEGFTLAAVLLLCHDEVILSVLPHHCTDALLRRVDLDRYDDRDDIRTNLLESYDRLMAFAAKHLPDPFFLENTQRISIRDHIFREVAVNMLIHREFLNPYYPLMRSFNDYLIRKLR